MNNNRYTQNKTKLRKGEYKRPNGTFEYRWKDKFGKNHVVYAKTLSELRVKEDDITRDILDGIDFSKLESTINDYFEIWKKIKIGIRETTFVSYVRTYERYVEPQFGKMKLKNISYSDVALFYTNLSVEKGLNYSSIRNINKPLSGALDIAVKDGVLRYNPCKGALHEIHRQNSDDTEAVRALTIKEQKIFEDFLAKPGHFHVYRPIFTFMLWTGMRVGEVVGLRWEDIDFENNEISVNHTLMCYDIGKGKGSAYKINPPKTKSSIRTVPMLPKVREALLEAREYQKLLGIKCESVIDGYTDFVFLNCKGKVFHHKKLNFKLYSISAAINRELQKEENDDIEEFPRIHNHMLRHTFATRMREAGADMKATSDMMGHEGILITLKTYTDASSEFKHREISLLQDYIEKAM